MKKLILLLVIIMSQFVSGQSLLNAPVTVNGTVETATGTPDFWMKDGKRMKAMSWANVFSAFSAAIPDPTLQSVLDNDHDLFAGRNYQGTDAGLGSTGSFVNAFGNYAGVNNTSEDSNFLGQSAGYNNTGLYTNFFGALSGVNNTGGNANAFGWGAGQNNTFKNVNLFGYQATADAENQTVFSKWISGGTKYLARLSFNGITANRKWEFPDTSGTLATETFVSASNYWTKTGNDISTNVSGNVGIGITSPDARLVVKNSNVSDNTNVFKVKSYAGTTTFAVAGNGNFSGFYGYAPYWNIPTGGGAFGSASGYLRMTIPPSEDYFEFNRHARYSAASLLLSYNAGDLVPKDYVDTQIAATGYWTKVGNDIWNNNTGNVGFGTSSPGQKFHFKVATNSMVTMAEYVPGNIIWNYFDSGSNQQGYYVNALHHTFMSAGANLFKLTPGLNTSYNRIDYSSDFSGSFTTRSLVDKAFVDNLKWKAPVKGVSNTNITLSGNQTVDGGIVISTGFRCLVNGQTTATQNGIYIGNTAGAWTRADDALIGSSFQNVIVPVLDATYKTIKLWSTTHTWVVGAADQFDEYKTPIQDDITKVPFTGASSSVDLGSNNLTAEKVSANGTYIGEGSTTTNKGIFTDGGSRIASFDATTSTYSFGDIGTNGVDVEVNPVGFSVGNTAVRAASGGLMGVSGNDAYIGDLFFFLNGTSAYADQTNELLVVSATAGIQLNGSKVLYEGVNNATTVVLTSATLNSTYPTVTTGFKVYCTSIIAGKMIYEKTPTGWVGYACIIP